MIEINASLLNPTLGLRYCRSSYSSKKQASRSNMCSTSLYLTVLRSHHRERLHGRLVLDYDESRIQKVGKTCGQIDMSGKLTEGPGVFVLLFGSHRVHTRARLANIAGTQIYGLNISSDIFSPLFQSKVLIDSRNYSITRGVTAASHMWDAAYQHLSSSYQFY